ncbi:MAG: hypothetical protein KAR42_17695 [candidate division Zixibacteria bacterium]|nr:hypothetical protein [candidate division Zixibacteria bacterium]
MKRTDWTTVFIIAGLMIGFITLLFDKYYIHECPEAETVNVEHRFPDMVLNEWWDTEDNDSMIIKILHKDVYRFRSGECDSLFYGFGVGIVDWPTDEARIVYNYKLDTTITADTICYRKEECGPSKLEDIKYLEDR